MLLIQFKYLPTYVIIEDVEGYNPASLALSNTRILQSKTIQGDNIYIFVDAIAFIRKISDEEVKRRSIPAPSKIVQPELVISGRKIQ
jgi:hypothetical protein